MIVPGSILAIDPGPTESAWVHYDRQARRVVDHSKVPNTECFPDRLGRGAAACVIEMVASYGMPVGRDVFETCVWIGRFLERWEEHRAAPVERITRKEVVLCLCGTPRAKDANVRQALIDRFGGRETAIGGRRCPACHGKGWRGRGRPTCSVCEGSGWEHPPGPLHGITSDRWAALGVAVAWADLQQKENHV